MLICINKQIKKLSKIFIRFKAAASSSVDKKQL